MAIKAPAIENPAFADVHIKTMALSLMEHLDWLDVAFGRAQRIIKTAGSKPYKIPAVYLGTDEGKFKNEYIELSPDSRIGNFSFFYMLEPETFKIEFNHQGYVRAPFALIFWFDLRKIYDAVNIRDTETLKQQIIKCVNRQTRFTNGAHIELTRVYETAEQIYREFTLDEIDNQFLMHPFAGFRFEGVLKFEEPC